MGAQLSVQEKAYQALSRELSKQNGSNEQCLHTFLESVPNVEDLLLMPQRKVPQRLRDLLIEAYSSLRHNIDYVFTVSNLNGAYVTASTEAESYVATIMQILKKSSDITATCARSAIEVLRVMIFHQCCKGQPKFDEYEESFREEFDKEKGADLIASYLNWNNDKNYEAMHAACALFNQMFTEHLSSEKVSSIAEAATSLVPMAPILSVYTKDEHCQDAFTLLKSILLYCKVSELQDLQTIFMTNGTFLYHLHKALKTPKKGLTMSKEFIMMAVAGSSEGRRTLNRIFPTPVVNQLDLSPCIMSVVERGRIDTFNDPTDLAVWNTMALPSVFMLCRENWENFWNCINTSQSSYNFIWDNSMLNELLLSLEKELEDVDAHEHVGDAIVWDYEGYKMIYPNVEQFVCVDGYYLQQVIDTYEKNGHVLITKPVEFIQHLCDLFIVTSNVNERRVLLYLIRLIVQHEEEAAKNFPIIRYLCYLLQYEEIDYVIKVEILKIMEVLCNRQRNTEQIQDYNGFNVLSRELMHCLNNIVKNEEPQIIISDNADELHCQIQVEDSTTVLHILINIANNMCNSMIRTRSMLLSEPYLSRLLRVLLLIPDDAIASIIIHIISLSLASSPRCQSTIYESGLFSVLLYKACSSTALTREIADIFYDYHFQDSTDVQSMLYTSTVKQNIIDVVKQASNDKLQVVELAKEYSYLKLFLPIPLIVILTREGPEAFVQLFNADNVENSEVLWNKELRLYLQDCLKNHFQDYLNQCLADYHYDWKYIYPTQVKYESLENELIVYNVFLEAFLKPESSVPATVDPNCFVKELIKEVDRRCHFIIDSKYKEVSIYDDIIMILKSILKVLQTKTEVSNLEKTAFETLCRCLHVDLNIAENRAMADTALDVITEAMKPASFGKLNTANIIACAQAKGIIAFDWILQRALEEPLSNQLDDHNEGTIYSAVGKSLNCICLMATKTIPQSIEALVAYPQFIETLINYTFVDDFELRPDITLAVIKAFELFLLDNQLLEICVNSGCILYFLLACLCFVINTEIDRQIIFSIINCLKILVGYTSDSPSSTTIVNAMTQCITPGLMKSLKNDTFIDDIRADNIRNPILIWNRDMATTLVNVLEKEDEEFFSAKAKGQSFWNITEFCHKDSYLHTFPCLSTEYIIDDVFLAPFLEQPNFNFVDPTADHFMNTLLAAIAQLQTSCELEFDKQSKQRIIDRLLVYTQSLYYLLINNDSLQTQFVNNTNIHKLFALLEDNAIGWTLQSCLLDILTYAVSTESGCDILSCLVPKLYPLLASNCEQSYQLILKILKQFIENTDQTVHLIMSSNMILILLDMILFYHKEYDGIVQDLAVHLIGRMMKKFNYGESVQQYMKTLFTPLFTDASGNVDCLLQCDEFPDNFLNIINSDIYDPNVYWDNDTRNDLLKFLTIESHTIYKKDCEYNYNAEEVNKRMKNYRITLNKQLIVADIFVLQYIESPFCEMNAPAFLSGLISKLNEIGTSFKPESKEAENYSALIQALNLFLQSNTEKQKPELYSQVVQFCILTLKQNVKIAQQTILSILKYLITKEFGLNEFIRNNSCDNEESYIVELLYISYALGYNNESSVQIVEIIKGLITTKPELIDVAYHGGAFIYGLFAVLSNMSVSDSHDRVAKTYLEIIKEIVSTNSDAEDELIEITTTKFKGQFQKEPSIVNLFIRKSHEAFAVEGKIRVWNESTKEDLRDSCESIIKKMSNEIVMKEKWNRTTNRYGLEEVKEMWKKHIKSAISQQPKFDEENTAIKRRQTTIGPRPNYVANVPLRTRADSM